MYLAEDKEIFNANLDVNNIRFRKIKQVEMKCILERKESKFSL